ncbi:phosphodiester glycosidase family protein [Thermoflavimicrobium daqui]|uniref:Metallophosphoesterase n=1 Tax=Thermoflavimicrobium daqui TaxID=2137476 RepID=A0A364K530_9BACL|nr:phosphodiester glycosidase family protein [Thermoflavimicrobium daqui]RAL24475.1 hypothetical protein DL897_09165 [Thermoflavimicrobium daqui]
MNKLRKTLALFLTFFLLLIPISVQGAINPIHESGELQRIEPRSFVPNESQNNPTLIHQESTKEMIASGIELTRFHRFDSLGWNKGATLSVELTKPGVQTNLLTPGQVASSEALSKQMQKSGAIAGVNGDFFDIRNTQAPLGAAVQNGKVLKSGGTRNSAFVSKDHLGQITSLLFEGKVVAQEKTFTLSAINNHSIENDHLNLYTSDWGNASRQHLKEGAHVYSEVLIRDRKIVKHFDGQVYSDALKDGESLLSGKGKAAEFLRSLSVGDSVDIQIQTRPNAKDLFFAVGAGDILVKDGEVATKDNGPVHPRTAIGFSKDRKKMILTVVDGRSNDSRGMTLMQLAEFMKEQGAYHAVNLDGGGSSTMVSRPLGEGGLKVVNSPSDGQERPVPNGVGVWNNSQTGKIKGFKIETRSDRVFPKFSRDFKAFPYDTAYAPMKLTEQQMHWYANGSIGTFKGNGSIFKAMRPGKGYVTVRHKAVSSRKEVRVLGELASLSIKPDHIGLDQGKTANFLVTGKDAEGYETYIEPRDIQLSYDNNVIEVKAGEDGSFTVIPKTDQGATLIKAKAGKFTAHLGVTVGLKSNTIETFEDQSKPWKFEKFPTEVIGSLSYVDSPGHGGKAIKLDYDFTTSDRTRAVYTLPPNTFLELSGDVKKIGVKVYGDEGNHHWLRTRIRDANGTYHTLDLANQVNWKGWKYVEAAVPAGVKFPISLNQIYLVEPDIKKKDKGFIILDDVTTKVSTTLDVPETSVTKHPMVLQNKPISTKMWKFAVLTDLHLVSDSPESKEVKNAIAAIKDVQKSGVDFIVFNGDMIDHDTKENFAFLKKLLDEHVNVPYYVVPGNHESYGSGNLNHFLQTFRLKNAFQTFDHKGTRFVILNTSQGGLRASDSQQWPRLLEVLNKTKKDQTIQKLVILGHHPLFDQLSSHTSQFTDSKEAALVQKQLTQFKEESKKEVMMITGHAHSNHFEKRDGVTYAIVGPNGKRPYAPKDKGGFFAYAVFGMSQNASQKQQSMPLFTQERSRVVDVRPILEDAKVDKEAFSVGKEETVTLIGIQADNYTFPIQYPANVQFIAGEGLVIKEKQGQITPYVNAYFDPQKKIVYFIREGTAKLTMKVGSFEKTFILEGK